ncbi:methyl-accepting chemotaxis protein [Acetobacterium wieringae]|uniref:Methyl-accepting chemotaxis protein IV n=1 Tax=Acetobacterium wieringae TaxID=52694 RepID=A0A1F2PE59_9FIRM|nr:methyl-accepting chemotaxis protein [Acetobacterium wieringae]OFV69690.1 methyl-accepting chemotaxis protein IV [Acetobacterium wieringae]
MNWFKNLKIKTKLLTSFILIALLVGVVGFIGIINTWSLQESDQELYENMTVPISQVGQMSTTFQKMRVNLRDMILANDPALIQSIEKSIAEDQQKIDTLADDYQKTIQTDEMQEAFDSFEAARTEYNKHLDVVKTQAALNQDTEAFNLMSPDGAAGKATAALQTAIDNLSDLKLADGLTKSEENFAQAAGVTTTMTIIMIISMIIAVALGLVLTSLICGPLRKANHMIQEMSKGHLSNRLNIDTTDEVGEMATTMDKMADSLQFLVIGTINRISEGDVSMNVEITDPQDEIGPALKKTIETIRALITEANALSQAAVEGRLDTRGHADAFSGGFREIVAGVNSTLDAVVGPLNVAAEYIERIGKGEIPPKITDEYYGDFREIKNNLNACLDGLGALSVADHTLKLMNKNDLTQAIDGDFDGIFGEIARSINGVHAQLGRIVSISTNIRNGDLSDLDFLRSIGKRSENDRLVPALLGMTETILMLVEETRNMAQIAISGDLNNRGDVTKFQGEYATVIEGFNQTLDAIIDPIQAASATLNELAEGNLKITMDGDFKGQHGKIKHDMNQTIEFLRAYVEEITHTLEEMSRGNFDLEITNLYCGDFLAIKKALNQIAASLSTTLYDINVAASQVDIGAQQISDSGQALSHGTTEQASSIQELTASIEEVAAETKRNAQNANEANELAINVRSNAEVGNSQMVKMVAAMSEINDSSHNISKIIKVIDDIAFQTNILALNAAVEAARAGQHGKGFAVVAEEVRTLAARSAEAAKETTGLIEGSIDKVEVGTKIADETALGLAEILKQIEKVTDLVGRIARASNDQASEIAQINQGIEAVSQVVQTNSATAEQSAAASEELSGQAEMLKQMVDAFKLKNTKNQPARPVTDYSESLVLPQSEIILDNLDFDKY